MLKRHMSAGRRRLAVSQRCCARSGMECRPRSDALPSQHPLGTWGLVYSAAGRLHAAGPVPGAAKTVSDRGRAWQWEGDVHLHCALPPCAPYNPSCLLTYRQSSVGSGTVQPCSALFSRTRHGPVHARHAAAGAFRRAPARCLTTFSLFTPAARPAPHHEDRHLPARPPAARQRQVRCCAAAAAAVWCCRLSAALRRPWHALFGPLIAL